MTNKGKQCIKIPYNRSCTPKVCGLLNCEHAENVDGMTGDEVERLIKAIEDARTNPSVKWEPDK